jgi:hypothetical protein
MQNEILFRLVVNGKTICERYNLDEIHRVKENLTEAEKQHASVIPITKEGSQFLLG